MRGTITSLGLLLLHASLAGLSAQELVGPTRYDNGPLAPGLGVVDEGAPAAWLQAGEYARAEQGFRKRLASGEKRVEILDGLGMALMGQGKPGDACGYFHLATEVDRGSADAWFNLGTSLQACTRFDEAVEAYGVAVLLRPDWADAYHKRAAAMWADHKLEIALDSYRIAVHLEPSSVRWADYGFALLESGQAARARNAFQAAIAANEHNGNAWFGMGASRKASGDYTGCRDAWAKALDLMPDNPRVMVELAFATMAASDPSGRPQAEQLLKKALAIDDTIGLAWFTLGTIRSDQGCHADAVSCFLHSLSLNYQPEKSAVQLAEALVGCRQLESAGKVISVLDEELNPDHSLRCRLEPLIKQVASYRRIP